MNQLLWDAYRRTSFVATTPGGRVALRVGERCAELDAVLADRGVTTWAYVTAFNPASVPLRAQENAARQRRLEQVVAGLGLESFRGEGIADHGRWPPEPSILVLGIEREEAQRLAREFGQLAILHGEMGREPQLLECAWDGEAIEELIARGHLDLPAQAISTLPPPDRRSVAFDRVAGMLLGLAVGDALGNTSESRPPGVRRDEWGEIRDFLPNRHAGGSAVGLPSDDTQLAFWMLESLQRHGRVVPDELAAIFSTRRIFGIGRTVATFVREYRQGKPWYAAAPRSAGNGALMRIAPVVIPHLGRPSAALWTDAILAGAVTHNDRSSIAACVAFVAMLWEALAMTRPPDPAWWLDTYCARARVLEGGAMLEARHPTLRYRGPIWRLVDTEVRSALAARLPALDACEQWYSGAFLLETVPSVLYILARHADDPELAIVRAVNDTRDNDTIAAIVGAAVGALHGRQALPERWIAGLAGRTDATDDGRIFELIEQARERFGLGDP